MSAKRSPTVPRSSRHPHAPQRFAVVTSSAVLLVALVCVNMPLSHAAPFNVVDAYLPNCTLPEAGDANTSDYSLWSSPSTWGGGPIPGVDKMAFANVTIPCGAKVLLDVPFLQLHTLIVQGWLRVLDDPSLPKLELQAHYVIVQGYVGAGSAASPFSQKVTFTLLPNVFGNRVEYPFTLQAPADRANPRSLGHKCFAVVGGQVDLHGMPGSPSTPSWVRLAATAYAKTSSIVVDADVAAWPVGATIAIASTAIDPNEAETAVIKGVSPLPSGWLISLSSPLKYSHEGLGLIRAEVALLNRSVVIQGTDEPAPYQLEGGHFIVYMTPTPQYIEGVQFSLLGIQGTLGRYPLHFHICGDSQNASVVRKNVVVNSKQRCVVIHATSNLTIEDNVAYESRGHCFMCEEGSELNNLFIRNLGMSTRAVTVMIPQTPTSPQSDNIPTTFWAANGQNNFVDNVGAGSENSGFWIEIKPFMRGASANLPGLGKVNPFTLGYGKYTGNVAHSSLGGFRSYPHGTNPWVEDSKLPILLLSLSNFVVYRCITGMFFHQTRSLTLTGSTFIDNWVAVQMKVDSAIVIANCTIIGRTQPCNATSSSLSSSAISAAPPGSLSLMSRLLGRRKRHSSILSLGSSQFASFLKFASSRVKRRAHLVSSISAFDLAFDEMSIDSPPNFPGFGRIFEMWRRGGRIRNFVDKFRGRGSARNRVRLDEVSTKPLQLIVGRAMLASDKVPVGISFSQSSPRDNNVNINITDVTFKSISVCVPCSPAVVLYTREYGGFWNPAISFSDLSFDDSTNRLWAEPVPTKKNPVPCGNQLSRYYAVRDTDGSFIGSPGYALGTFTNFLPENSVLTKSCQRVPAWGPAWACSGVCYRAPVLWYTETSPSVAYTPRTGLPYSYAVFSRSTDGQRIPVNGSDNQFDNKYGSMDPIMNRGLSAPLLTGRSYQVSFVAPAWNPKFFPQTIRIVMQDAGGCQGPITIVLTPPNATTQWVLTSPLVTTPCNTASTDPTATYYRKLCVNGLPSLAIDIGAADYDEVATAKLAPLAAGTACVPTTC